MINFILFVYFQGPNSVMIALVMLLNIGLAILFVHFLTWLELGKVSKVLFSYTITTSTPPQIIKIEFICILLMFPTLILAVPECDST